MGRDAAGVANRDTLADPATFDWFVAFARRGRNLPTGCDDARVTRT
jgi:hypothetical protein